MFKGFKISSKKDTHKKGLLTSDISGPTTINHTHSGSGYIHNSNDTHLRNVSAVSARNTSSSSLTKHLPLNGTGSATNHNTNCVASINSSNTNYSGNSSNTSSNNNNNLPSLYAIVLYDFTAEKSDELTCHTGENLFICAHHNHEWFVAKPIGRLGGPGLVPVSFVSIIDISTGYATGNNVRYDIDNTGLPTVKEWKESIARYKASNIALGTIEQQHKQKPQNRLEINSTGININNYHYERDNNSIGKNLVPSDDGTSSFIINNYNDDDNAHSNSTDEFEFGNEIFVLDAAIESYSLETSDNKYWFNLACVLSDGHVRSLKRYYEDFYDLQVSVLDAFPAESGKSANGKNTTKKQQRIIPYIPGPVPFVTETITMKRKEDLNLYVKDLINLPPYISRCEIVLKLFEVKQNRFDKEFIDNDNTVKVNNIKSERSKDILAEKQKIKQQEQEHILVTNSGNTDNNNYDVNYNNNESTLTGKDISEQLQNLTIQANDKPKKVKFYYKEDIFALLLKSETNFDELAEKVRSRVDSDDFKLYVKIGDNQKGEEITSETHIREVIEGKLKILVIDT
ncbi:phosphatidylinositol-3-phosphate-binding protein BEM1 SCDLUD_002012 [Saccharomycodes ludwigii]|uniref:phosphatidylinositol-3-phosphate-binding protein BEM1 n=1 Tax=Saccharomycodes ludwigii TaxID=36035 RepID=UPI001E857989|nr:hypothetical protein SCDLUD_002012 [Saccharomycodes ludwigii]KAH3902197.1 hypothetical protein SCDLUD_002012 [Saccharomycodes ludwigii]